MVTGSLPKRVVVLVLLGLALASCRRSAPPESKASEPAPVSTDTQAPRHHGNPVNGVSPLIVKLDPATITFRDGHLVGGRYTVEYDVLGIDKVKSIRIVFYAPGFGQVQSIDAPVDTHNILTIDLDPADLDLGPTVRLRAKCPEGTTDWYTLGTLPVDYQHRIADVFAVTSVSPPYIERRPNAIPGTGVDVALWGPRLNRACTPEAEVDGAPVELHNVFAADKQIKTLLAYSDIHGGPVVARYLEVKLQLMGDKIALEDIARLNFSD